MSQRAQRIKNGLIVSRRQPSKSLDGLIGFGWARRRHSGDWVGRRGGREVRLDGFQQIPDPSVMQKENTLTDSTERRGAEHVRPGGPLDDIVSQVRPHVVNQQIGVKVDRSVTQDVALDTRRGHHLRSVARRTPYGGKEATALLRPGRERRGLRRVEEPHEERESPPVRRQVEWIVEALIIVVFRLNAGDVVRMRRVRPSSL